MRRIVHHIMSSTRHPLRLVSTVVLALLLVTACGGPGEGSPGSSTTTSGTTGTAADDAADDAGSGDDGTGEESLADFLGFGDADDPAAGEARARQQQTEIEEAVRACMVEQGFEYTPVQMPDSAYAMTSDDDTERRQTEGFGITTWFGNEETMAQGEEWIDPNQERMDEMSQAERDAYSIALYGDPEDEESTTEIDPETGEEITVYSGFGGGCQGAAYEAVYGDTDATQALWDELTPAFEELNARIEADPRIVELNAEWSACMADAGFDYASRTAMYEDIFESFQTRLDEITGGGDPLAGMSEDEVEAFFENRTDEEIDAFFSGQQQLDSEGQAALEALQQEEIDLAVADGECGDGLDDAYLEVSQRYEADLIAENRDVLEQIRELQGGS